ncbi:MAG: aldehyde dehydrogenase family protein, partial [FCB group bacterium]|nr:aldehyde dehydrogenase family protein [FCB group bacterium]
MDTKHLEHVMLQQKAYFAGGGTRNIAFRREALLALKQMIRQNESVLMDALAEDLHKSRFESYITEIGHVYKEIDGHIRHLKRLSRTRRIPTPLVMFPSRSRILREPYGTVLIVAPWNYPLNLALIP